jgi:hypothetical protein
MWNLLLYIHLVKYHGKIIVEGTTKIGQASQSHQMQIYLWNRHTNDESDFGLQANVLVMMLENHHNIKMIDRACVPMAPCDIWIKWKCHYLKKNEIN